MESLRLTDRGLYWLKVNICSEYGLDKLTFDKQVEWVSKNSSALETLESEADNTFAYRNAVAELRNYEQGKETHYIMPLDCSNQALQLYGVLSGDKQTASLGSLGTGEIRVDAYQMLADYLNKKFNHTIFTRNVCKKPLMVTLYGSTQGGNQLLNNLHMDEVMLADKLGVTYEEDFIQRAFEEAMEAIAPYCMRVMDKIQLLNDKDIGTYQWTLPDGFKVKYDVKTNLDMNLQARSRSGKNFSVTLTSEVYQASEYNRGMAPNVIHSVDGYVLREIVRGMGNSFITTIHDSYSVHPNEVDKLREVYSAVLCNILDSNLLENIMTQIAGQFKGFIKQDTLTKEDIKNSTYSLA